MCEGFKRFKERFTRFKARFNVSNLNLLMSLCIVRIQDDKVRFKLDSIHIQYLTDQRTLNDWAGKSLVDRCKLFHR